jgi:hypothetical protein
VICISVSPLNVLSGSLIIRSEYEYSITTHCDGYALLLGFFSLYPKKNYAAAERYERMLA